MLKVELQELTDAGLDVAMVGFSPEELNVLFNGWQSDIESVEKHGENTDGIGATLKLKVSEESKQLAVQAVTNALDAAGVEYEWA
jgi:hypothetical protein